MKVYRIPFVMHGIAEVEAMSAKEARRIFEEMDESKLVGFIEVVDYDDGDDLNDEE